LAGLGFLATVGTLVSAGEPQRALDVADELLPMLRGSGNLFHDGMPLMLRASALLETNGPSRALPDATAAMRECLTSGVDRLICYAAAQLFSINLAGGRPRTAARWAREVISVARSAEHASFVALGMSNLACALAVVGDAAGARETLRALAAEQLDVTRPAGAERSWAIAAQAWTLAAEGRLSRAAELLENGAKAARDRGQWSAAGSLLHDCVRLGGASTAVLGLREVAERCTSPLIARQLRQAEAVLAADVDELAEVAQEWDSLGSPLVAAEALLVAARAARDQGSARRATALTARGAELAARCQGAKTPDLAHGDRVDPLSPREREIAALASRGLRSREIADSLVVSIRTVDNHLQAIYGKLGIAGRRELASALRLS
jgi:DNA-binding CsgD family transcriptional regulator